MLWSDDGGELFSPILPIVERKTGTQSFPRQSFVDAVFGLGHSRLFSRCQSPQCRPGQKRQVSSRGMNRGTPPRPLALRDDLVTPIVVCVCCCHRRTSQGVPVFCRNPASAMRFTSGQGKKSSLWVLNYLETIGFGRNLCPGPLILKFGRGQEGNPHGPRAILCGAPRGSLKDQT